MKIVILSSNIDNPEQAEEDIPSFRGSGYMAIRTSITLQRGDVIEFKHFCAGDHLTLRRRVARVLEDLNANKYRYQLPDSTLGLLVEEDVIGAVPIPDVYHIIMVGSVSTE